MAMIGVMVTVAGKKETNPWNYVRSWAMSDRDSTDTLERLNDRLQRYWPGPYTVVWEYLTYEYKIKFYNPADETLYRLKWV